jgi:threonine/homoserine/homoserine lactone efflux protein
MVPWTNVLAFAIASALLIMIPGPSVLFVLGRSISLGRRGGLISVLGNALGMLPAIAAVALGIGALVAQSVVVFTVVKVVGAAYLIFLGIQAIRHRKLRAQPDQSTAPRSTFRLLAEGFVVGITNPKTIAFFVAVLPQFVDHSAGAISWQLAELGLIFFALALIMDGCWALLAGTARDWFARSPKRIERMSAAGGGMMIGLGGVLLVSTAEH